MWLKSDVSLSPHWRIKNIQTLFKSTISDHHQSVCLSVCTCRGNMLFYFVIKYNFLSRRGGFGSTILSQDGFFVFFFWQESTKTKWHETSVFFLNVHFGFFSKMFFLNVYIYIYLYLYISFVLNGCRFYFFISFLLWPTRLRPHETFSNDKT